MYKDIVRIGITLSGGGARGIGHIGILQALEEEGIIPDIICGTSAGALVGCLYAYGIKPAKIMEIAKKSNLRKVFRLVLPVRGLSKQDFIIKQLKEHIPENSFDCLRKEFYVGLTNLNTGRHEIWSNGPLFDVIEASSAVPGIFQPIRIQGADYVDGGVMNNMPAEVIRNQCDFLIASNVVTKVEKSSEDLKGLKSILARVFEISLWYRSRLNYDVCDMVIEPQGLNNFHIFNFSKSQEIYDFAYQGAKQKIQEIKHELDGLASIKKAV